MTESSPVYSMMIKPSLEAIAYARLAIRRTLPVLDDTTAALFYGAATEILSNAIAAHERHGIVGSIRIDVIGMPEPAVVVTDRGLGFDPGRAESDAVSPGLGLKIARSACPDLKITSSPSGTIVSLPYPIGSPP